MSILNEEDRIKVNELIEEYNKGQNKNYKLLIPVLVLLPFLLIQWINVLVFIAMCFFVYKYSKNVSSLKNQVKNDVFAGIVKYVNASFEYTTDSIVTPQEADKARLYDCCGPNVNFHIENSISGIIKNNHVRIIDLYIGSNMRGEKYERSGHRIFKGMFIIIDFEESFKSQIKIAQKYLYKDMDVCKQKVDIENTEFEKIFIMLSDDKIYAKEVSSTYVEKLGQLSKKLNKKMNLSFVENKLYIAIDDMSIINYAELFRSGMNMQKVEGTIEHIKNIESSIDYLLP